MAFKHLWTLVSGLDWPLFSVLVSVLGVILANCYTIIESRRGRFSRSIDLLLRLTDEFDTTALRAARKAAALNLLESTHQPGADKPQKIVLNFFEKVGYLQNRGALDAKAVWQELSTWLIPYFYCSSALIEKLIQRDPNTYAQLRKAYNRIEAIEKRNNGTGSIAALIAPTAIQEFLRNEAA
jgi:hypothetical protein